MFSIFRGVAVYIFLLIIFRIAGKRSLAQITTFDFVLLLIISDAVQQALIVNDNSIVNAFLLVITLVGLDIGISLLKFRSEQVDKLMDSIPLILVDHGKPIQERMKKERVDEADIMARARELQGLERMEQIKYAVLETNGGITIIPMEASQS